MAIDRAALRVNVESAVNSQSIKMDLDQAATCIQARIRGVLVRKSLPAQFSFERQYNKLMRLTGVVDHTTATSGKTPVWFPKACPGIVMKFSENPQLRLAGMDDVRGVLQSQKSSHAIVPIAKECTRAGQTLLIEERVPGNTDPYYNMWLYLHSWAAFDQVVRELVQLYSEKGGLGDLQGESCHPLMPLENVGSGIRYDNFPLYLNRKGEGCVGLIDLEHMGTQTFLAGCQMLARIFPFHKDLILDEAKKCGHALERGTLDSYALQGKQALEAGIQRHEEWLENKIKKQIEDTSNPITSLSRDRKLELIALVKQMLLHSYEKEGLAESSNAYTITDTPMYPLSSQPLPPGFLYNPLDTKVDVDWMLHPEIDLAHPEISAETLATNIALWVLEYFTSALPKDGSIPSFKTCKKGAEWAGICARSPTIEFGQLFSTIERMVGAHQRHIMARFIDLEEMQFPTIETKDIVDAIMKNLIAHEDIFSCDIHSSGYYWLRY